MYKVNFTWQKLGHHVHKKKTSTKKLSTILKFTYCVQVLYTWQKLKVTCEYIFSELTFADII